MFTEVLKSVQLNPGATESLELSDLNLESVSPALFSETFSSLKSVNLRYGLVKQLEEVILI